MTKKWGAMNVVHREPSGRFFKALIGPYTGQVGQAVHFHRWGGLDLEFADGAMATFANDDVEEVSSEEAGFDLPLESDGSPGQAAVQIHYKEVNHARLYLRDLCQLWSGGPVSHRT